MPFYERQPYITPLYQILLEILRGEIRVPRFQRPGTEITWTPDQRGDLLDSLYRGFPVGTILLWSTQIELPSLPKVAGFSLGENANRKGPMRALLDGHQRLSTLLAILGPGLLPDVKGMGIRREDVLQERWTFESRSGAPRAGESPRDRFILLKKGQEPTDTQIPLENVFDRPKMNRWIRDHHEALGDDGVRLAESVRDKLREYAIPVAVLAADSLDEATESFKRVNSSGTPMSSFHMVAALAYMTDFNLPEVFEDLKGQHLGPLGWGELEDTDILRVYAGLSEDVHPAKLKAETIARHLRGRRDEAERAITACAHAASALAELGIHGPESLPYAWQLITLAIVLGKRDGGGELTKDQKQGLRSWFWVTTYGAVFAGANSAIYDRASEALAEMLQPGLKPWTATRMESDVARFVEEVGSFDFRAARAKAFCLLLARIFDNEDTNGAGHRALALRGAEAVQPLRPGKPRSAWSELTIVRVPEDLKTFRESLKPFRQMELVSNEQAIPPVRLGLAEDGTESDLQGRMAARKRLLLQRERDFVKSFGLEWR